MKLIFVALVALLLNVHSSMANGSQTDFLQKLLNALEYALKHSDVETEDTTTPATTTTLPATPATTTQRVVDCVKFCARDSNGVRKIKQCAGRRRKNECLYCRVNLRCMIARGVVFS